jgi:hypothetical protein
LELSYKKPKLFSKIDLKSGFFQLSIDPQCRLYTAHSTPLGKMEFARLPMGLRTSPIAFAQAMNCLFCEELYEDILLYMDDLLLYSSTAEKHMDLLHRVFGKFRAANLRLSPTKSSFFLPKIVFLGFQVSEEGIKIDPSRFDLIRSYPAAKTTKQVRSMLGMFQYFRHFIPQFAKITAPLRQLLTKEGSANFRWEDEHNQALQQLKDAVLRNATLIFADMNAQFCIWVDSCKSGLSYALSQVQPDGKHQFISFGGRATRSYEQRYGSSDLEITGLLAALRQYNAYLSTSPHPILVKTDNISLTYLDTLKRSTGKHLRYSVLLQQYNLQFSHVPGKLLFVDHLSRLEYPKPPVEDPIPEMEIHTHDYLNQIDIFDDLDTVQKPRKRKLFALRLSTQQNYLAPVITRRQHAQARQSPSDGQSSITNNDSASIDMPTRRPRRRSSIVHEQSIDETVTHDESLTSHSPVVNDDLMSPDVMAEACNITKHNVDIHVNLNTQRDDPLFANIIQYLVDGTLPTDKALAQRILIQQDDYFIADDKLFHLANFRGKRLNQIQRRFEQLCVPKQYRLHVIQHFHQLAHDGRYKLVRNALSLFIVEL